jgi:hypothetical protein
MVRFVFGLVLPLALASACKPREYDAGALNTDSAEKTVRVVITKSPVEKLAFVIGVENNEASCHGGNAKYRVNAEVGTGVLPELLVSPSVTRIELCAMPGSAGYPTKQFRDLKLEANQTIVIHGDVISQAGAIPDGRARVLIMKPIVHQLVRVIGIDSGASEVDCRGGNPRFFLPVTGDSVYPLVFDVPSSIDQIALCGQATPTGMQSERRTVKLTLGAVSVIE